MAPRVTKEILQPYASVPAADFAPRRQTRAFAASLQAFAYNTDGTAPESPRKRVKLAPSSDESSSLSSSVSGNAFDIEDLPFSASVDRKRKRGLDTPSTAVTSISTSTSTRKSPRKPSWRDGDDDSVGSKIRAKRQPAKRILKENGEEEVQPPTYWREIYTAVQEMRKEKLAPVDTMGCETLADEEVSPRDKRFQTLIALMLSSQTKDTTNAIAMRRLQDELPKPGLTLENILAIDPVKLNEMIWVVGFHNNKTRYIKAAALLLRDQWNSDIPDTIEGLMSLPGVGPKMAYLCLSAAWGRTEGIGVDVHVHRITNLWRWHGKPTKNPEETRASLESWLPRDKWHQINHLLVGFGQTICLPVGRKCGECTLSEKGLCPSAIREKKQTVRRAKVRIEQDEDKDHAELKTGEYLAVKTEEIVGGVNV